MERKLRRRWGIPGEVAMDLGLVMRRKMAVRGGILLVMVVRDRVVITGGRGCARMGKPGKEGLSAHPVVHHNVHGGEKKCQKNSTAHEAHLWIKTRGVRVCLSSKEMPSDLLL